MLELENNASAANWELVILLTGLGKGIFFSCIQDPPKVNVQVEGYISDIIIMFIVNYMFGTLI